MRDIIGFPKKHWRIGQSDILSTVILITVILIISAAFLAFSMVQFSNEAAQSSIQYVASFLTNVADDIDTFMFIPGALLTYKLPNTGYGVYNFVNSTHAKCIITVSALGELNNVPIINEVSGELIYGVPPNYFSLPPESAIVLRGSTLNGMPTSSLSDFSLIVSYSTSVLMGTSMALLQLGYGELGGNYYGTYLVMVPRIMVVNGTGVDGIGYVYIPLLSLMGSQGRSELVINIMNISAQSIVLNGNGGLRVNETCYFGNDAKPINSSVTVIGKTIYINIIQIGVGFR